MGAITDVRERAGDLHQRINPAMLERAYQDGMNFSRFLEEQDPSDEYNDGLSAFERQLKMANIVTRSNPEEGFYADRFQAFEENEHTRTLQVEWMARQWRKVSHMRRSDPTRRAIMASDDALAGSGFRPYISAAQERSSQIAPAIPIGELVALTTQIDGNAYRAIYLNDDPGEARLVRVGETAEIPGAKLTQGERTVDLYKFGRKVTASYELLRRAPIDTVAFHIARMAVQAEVDKVAHVLDIMINGDGNPNTSASVDNLTALDADAVAGTLSLRGWLAYKLRFETPYALTHEIAQNDVILDQLLLSTGTANIPVVTIQGAGGFGGFEPINPQLSDRVRYGSLSSAPASKVVGFDARFAIERVTEIGASLTETQRWVTNQTQDLVLSEVEGYAVVDTKAVRILDVAA